jgi:hypothetical protein
VKALDAARDILDFACKTIQSRDLERMKCVHEISFHGTLDLDLLNGILKEYGGEVRYKETVFSELAGIPIFHKLQFNPPIEFDQKSLYEYKRS